MSVDDERWLVVNGRRWRRTDPELAEETVRSLTSHLGRGRSGVRTAKSAGDDDAVALARRRVGLAKHGLGERGDPWWEMTLADRRRARRRCARRTRRPGRRRGLTGARGPPGVDTTSA